MPNTDNPVFAKTAILQVLKDSPGYGSQLAERIKTKSKDTVTLSPGAIYPVLKTMEQEELITKSKAKREDRVEIYRATAKGMALAAQNRKTVKLLFGL
jgi:DNA-binding PadR family transcriptional regulator